MNDLIQNFTHRQTMIRDDFEVFHYKDSSPLTVKYHNHDFYEILFFMSGDVTYSIEGFNYRLEPGDILFIDNNALHRPVVNTSIPYERVVFWFTREFAEKSGLPDTNLLLPFDTVKKDKNRLLRPNDEHVHAILEIRKKFEQANTGISYGSSVLRTLHFIEFLIIVNRAYIDSYGMEADQDKVRSNPGINDIITYINENIASDLSLEKLSKSFFISKYHMEREFKKYTGITLHKYITQKRLTLAKAYLQQGSSIVNTYQKCGFNDYSNFIRAFKKEYGLPPKQYISKKQDRAKGDGPKLRGV